MTDREMLMKVLRCVNGLVDAAKMGESLNDVLDPNLIHCDDFKVAWVIDGLMEFCEQYKWLKTTVKKMTDIVNYKDRP